MRGKCWLVKNQLPVDFLRHRHVYLDRPVLILKAFSLSELTQGDQDKHGSFQLV